MEQSFSPDWNSFISALIGGGLALLGTYLSMMGTKKSQEKEDSRELIALFYFLSSKVALILSLEKHPEGIPMLAVVTDDELADIRKRYAVASRALALEDIGEIELFCNRLRTCEIARKNWINSEDSRKQNSLNLYNLSLQDLRNSIIPDEKNKGINEIGKRIEYYFSKELKKVYTGSCEHK